MSERYRGWHYHIEHPSLSQEEIMSLLEKELERMGARRVELSTSKRLPGIGVVEAFPAKMSLWRLNGRETVLWISSVTGSLHIEANKEKEYARSILTKRDLIEILRRWGRVERRR